MFILALIGVGINLVIFAILGGHHGHSHAGHDHGHAHGHSHGVATQKAGGEDGCGCAHDDKVEIGTPPFPFCCIPCQYCARLTTSPATFIQHHRKERACLQQDRCQGRVFACRIK